MAIFRITIRKAKDIIEVDDAQFSDQGYAFIIERGLQTLLNSRMKKVEGANQAMNVAKLNLRQIEVQGQINKDKGRYQLK